MMPQSRVDFTFGTNPKSEPRLLISETLSLELKAGYVTVIAEYPKRHKKKKKP